MEWINEPTVTRNFATMSKKITRDEELAFLEKMIASETDRLFAIESDDGEYLGNAGIHRIYWPAKNGRLGVVVGKKSAQGKGVGTAALRRLCEIGLRRARSAQAVADPLSRQPAHAPHGHQARFPGRGNAP